MDAYPFRYEVGDLLGLGIPLEPEQAAVVEDPRTEAIAIVPLMEPFPESDSYYWYGEDGKPVLIPMPVTSRAADEPEQMLTIVKGKRVYAPATYVDVLQDELLHDGAYHHDVESLFSMPRAIGPIGALEGLQFYMPSWVSEETHAFPVWTTWRVTPEQSLAFAQATEQALHKSGFYELADYIQWENYGYDMCVDDDEVNEHMAHVKKIVLGKDGDIRDPQIFTPKLVLPKDREIRYIWDALQEQGQHGWDAWIQAHPDDQRRAIRQETENPWC